MRVGRRKRLLVTPREVEKIFAGDAGAVVEIERLSSIFSGPFCGDSVGRGN